MKKVLLSFTVVCLAVSSCSINGIEKTPVETVVRGLEDTSTELVINGSEKNFGEPSVLSTRHAGCLGKQQWPFEGPYCFPVGTLTVSLGEDGLRLYHNECMANCSVAYGDEFISWIVMHSDKYVIEFSTKLKKADRRCMCQTDVFHHISAIDEGTYTLRYIFCGAKFKDITLHLKEGQSETFDLKEYVYI